MFSPRQTALEWSDIEIGKGLLMASEGHLGDGSEKYLEVDGSVLEGGGQILRVSVALSALMGLPLRIIKIRGGRSKPGLRPQHMAGLNLVRQLCQANLSGCHMGSSAIEFVPGNLKEGVGLNKSKHFVCDSQTAGMTTLVAQVALPCLLYAGYNDKVALDLRGGTNAEMAPQVETFVQVFAPNLAKFCVGNDKNIFDVNVIRKGYFPKGGGRVNLSVRSLKNSLKAIQMTDAGRVDKIHIISSVAGTVSKNVAVQMAKAAENRIKDSNLIPKVTVWNVSAFKEERAFGNGSSIIIVAETTTGCILGGSAVGYPSKSPESVGFDAVQDLLESLRRMVCIDNFIQDQLVIFMALAEGTSRILTGPLTLHTRTAIHTAELLTKAKFNVRHDTEGGNCLLECTGIGLKPY